MGPVTAYVYVTLRCNARCEFCRIWREQTAAPPDMPLDLGLKVVEELGRMRVRHVDFTGGEPLLSDPLPELMARARSLGMYVSLTSNGMLYPMRAEEMRGLADSLGFSLNGPDAETHDRAQGVGSFDHAVESIRLAKSLREPVHAHFTATNESIERLNETRALARDLGVPLVVFPEFSYFGNRSLHANHIETLARFAAKRGVCINTASLRFQRMGGNSTRRPVCRAGRSALAIAPDASLVLPCFHLELDRIPTDGDLRKACRGAEFRRIVAQSGRYHFCEGCTNWCYINPSFFGRPNALGLLHLSVGLRRLREVHGHRWMLAGARLVLKSLR